MQQKIHVNVVNRKKLKNLKYHIRRTVLALLIVGSIKGVNGIKDNTKATGNYELPVDYTTITLDISVDQNTSIKNLANMYYDETEYPEFKEYCKKKKKKNDIDFDIITPYQNIKMPLIVNRDNVYLNNIEALENTLNEIPIWVDYVVESGDTLSSLAYLGAKDATEAMENINRICDYNNISNRSVIQIGSKISIINPEIGEIKRNIYSLKEALKESLKVNEDNYQK